MVSEGFTSPGTQVPRNVEGGLAFPFPLLNIKEPPAVGLAMPSNRYLLPLVVGRVAKLYYA